ncbi:MAG: phosphoesterase [Alphaproteobacteria bacterium]|nr:phosphoesterase [Alphaproteobacteria bacterium]
MRARLMVATVLALPLAACAAAHKPPPEGEQAATTRPPVTAQPHADDPELAQYFIDPAHEPALPREKLISLLRQRIKYVFVIFNENESFDHEYGTFPGANGLYSDGGAPRGAEATPGFRQSYVDPATGSAVWVQPFRLGPQQNATAMDSADHSHKGLAAKLDVVDGTARMDGFAQVEFSGKSGPAKTEAEIARGRQYANLVMSYVDCDTIPFFWRYASRFTLFDNIFATEDTPSTPNAIAMIAGQSGETQWVKHGAAGTSAAMSGTINGDSYDGVGLTAGVPVVDDPNPFWGSQFDPNDPRVEPSSPAERYGRHGDAYNVSANLTFATVPLIAMGREIRTTLSGDAHPETNQADIARDIPAIEARGDAPVAWRWYQNGYDREPTDPPGEATHRNFVAHHEGPQYFGYLADNARVRESLRGLGDFFADLSAGRLPAQGGIVYVRGGFGNLQGLQTPIQNPDFPAALTPEDIAHIRAAKAGDDDHPAYGDRQISEAMAARVINAIAANPGLWSQSAIVITYDESDGFYDHVPPRILSYGPDGLPLSRGIRVPLLLISPYARVHAVAHPEGDHNAVIQTLEEVFGLPALASLPEEREALAAGDSPEFNRFGPPGFHQRYLGPRDINSPVTDSLLAGFDPARLAGTAPPLPGSYATIPEKVVDTLPHYGGEGCKAIGITPEDVRQGIASDPPSGFNSLPSTLPAYNGPSP